MGGRPGASFSIFLPFLTYPPRRYPIFIFSLVVVTIVAVHLMRCPFNLSGIYLHWSWCKRESFQFTYKDKNQMSV